MSNGEVCCILGVCCPPESAEQIQSMADTMAKETGLEPETCTHAAKWVLSNYDLAPHKSLREFKSKLAEHIRAAH